VFDYNLIISIYIKEEEKSKLIKEKQSDGMTIRKVAI